MEERRKGREKVSRGDWLRAALMTLKKEGIDRVRVESLAKKLNITKGSFYWNFKNRSLLLEELLRHWEERQITGNRPFLEAPRTSTGRERLRDYFHYFIRAEPDSHDPPVRVWARKDHRAAEAMERVDEKRLEILQKIFFDHGMKEQDAHDRAIIAYQFLIGEKSFPRGEGITERMNRANLFRETLFP